MPVSTNTSWQLITVTGVQKSLSPRAQSSLSFQGSLPGLSSISQMEIAKCLHKGPQFVGNVICCKNSEENKSKIFLNVAFQHPQMESVLGSPLPLNWVLSNFWTFGQFPACLLHSPSSIHWEDISWALTTRIQGKRSQVDRDDKAQMGKFLIGTDGK